MIEDRVDHSLILNRIDEQSIKNKTFVEMSVRTRSGARVK
jgi:hypothetical protein